MIAGIRQAPTGQLEAGIATQMIKVVGILLAAGNGQYARSQDVGHAVRGQQRITPIGNQSRQTIRDPQSPLCHAQQHYPAIGGEPTAIKTSRDLLAADGWKTERENRIVGHGGCGSD